LYHGALAQGEVDSSQFDWLRQINRNYNYPEQVDVELLTQERLMVLWYSVFDEYYYLRDPVALVLSRSGEIILDDRRLWAKRIQEKGYLRSDPTGEGCYIIQQETLAYEDNNRIRLYRFDPELNLDWELTVAELNPDILPRMLSIGPWHEPIVNGDRLLIQWEVEFLNQPPGSRNRILLQLVDLVNRQNLLGESGWILNHSNAHSLARCGSDFILLNRHHLLRMNTAGDVLWERPHPIEGTYHPVIEASDHYIQMMALSAPPYVTLFGLFDLEGELQRLDSLETPCEFDSDYDLLWNPDEELLYALASKEPAILLVMDERGRIIRQHDLRGRASDFELVPPNLLWYQSVGDGRWSHTLVNGQISEEIDLPTYGFYEPYFELTSDGNSYIGVQYHWGWVQGYRLLPLLTGTQSFQHSTRCELNCHPNPCNGRLQVEYHLERPGVIRLNLYNLLGQRVFAAAPQVLGSGLHTQLVDFDSQASGTYLLELEGSGGSLGVQRVVYLR